MKVVDKRVKRKTKNKIKLRSILYSKILQEIVMVVKDRDDNTFRFVRLNDGYLYEDKYESIEDLFKSIKNEDDVKVKAKLIIK
jgi:hypothetical protein